MLAELIYTQVLTELYDTNQSMNLLDEHGNTLVHAAARYHVPDCLSVRLHGCSYIRMGKSSLWKTLHVESCQKSF